jgi:RimJ/RimL family protein N-acetyltransferase
MISFQPLTPADHPLLLSWLQKPHVKAWWDDGDDTLEKVAQHYGSEAGTERWFIFFQPSESAPPEPIGYIQSYQEDEDGIGIDLFLGEERYLDRGIGTQALQAFIQQVRDQVRPAYFVIDPDPANARAIRCYEKVGFRHYATVLNEEGKPAYMMRLAP